MYVEESKFEEKYDECYAGFRRGTKQKTLQTVQNPYVDRKIRDKNPSKLILIGHHPIVYLKSKNEKSKYTQDIPRIFDSLQRIPKDLGVTYLCADLHLYQEGVITLKTGLSIKQYIVGTGGAKLDPSPKISSPFPTDDPNIAFYTIQKQAHRRFLSFSLHYPQINAVSKSRSPQSVADVLGGRKKTRKYRKHSRKTRKHSRK